jgi:hypothetical protein
MKAVAAVVILVLLAARLLPRQLNPVMVQQPLSADNQLARVLFTWIVHKPPWVAVRLHQLRRKNIHHRRP